MCRKMDSGRRFPLLAVALGTVVVAGAWAGSAATARAEKGPLAALRAANHERRVAAEDRTAEKQKEKEKAIPVEESLRAAHKLLCEADFDYKGHRAKAAEEVHRAMEELKIQHQHKVLEGKPAPEGEKAKHEAQQKSDNQLREAERILERVEKRGVGGKAAGNIKAAISEIQTALSIK